MTHGTWRAARLTSSSAVPPQSSPLPAPLQRLIAAAFEARNRTQAVAVRTHPPGGRTHPEAVGGRIHPAVDHKEGARPLEEDRLAKTQIQI